MWMWNWKLDGYTYRYLSLSNIMEIQSFGMDTSLASMMFSAIDMGSTEAYYRSSYRFFFQGRNSHLANPMHSWKDSKEFQGRESKYGSFIILAPVVWISVLWTLWMISGFIIRYLIHSEDWEFVGLEY